MVGRQEIVAGNDVYGNSIKRIQYDIKQMKVFFFFILLILHSAANQKFGGTLIVHS